MFNKVIIRALTASGLCRCCTKHKLNLQKCLETEFQLVSNSKRYINTCPLLFSQQHPKEKQTEENNEGQNNQNYVDDKKTTNESDESSDQNKSQENKHSSRKSEIPNLQGKEMILHSFAVSGKKEKDTFLECLRMYINQPGRKIERVFFINAALKYMEEFGVHKDLQVYKQLINIFPKEKMVPTNLFQTMYVHYPREQYCAVSILEQMEDNGVIPDSETELLLLNIFGRHGLPLEKFWKMMYWMPKFKNLNPWPVPNPIPTEPYELAKLAMRKISSIDCQSKITVYYSKDVEDSIDESWIVSAMAPTQKELLQKHEKKIPIFVEGPFQIYVATQAVDYFTLRADPIIDRKYPEWDPDGKKFLQNFTSYIICNVINFSYSSFSAVDKLRNPYLETDLPDVLPPTIHEQIDATIFANCATETSTKDSLLSWIRCLQNENPVLGEIPIIFTLRNLSEEEKVFIDKPETNKKIDSNTDDKFIDR